MVGLITWFLLLLGIGLPVAFVLGISATIYLVTQGGISLSVIPQRLFAGLDQFVLMSIPFFIMAGYVMNEAQLTWRLVQFANFLVGRWKGGLAQANVLTSMFFGGISGAATADVAAVGSILIPAMIKEGYRRDFTVAVTVASSIVGPLIPPSIPMLVYGVSSGASIGALFLAGVTPGIVVGLTMMGLNRYLLRNADLHPIGPPAGAGKGVVRDFLASLRIALVALGLPVIIVAGVVEGIFTPTESSVAAVIYALLVGLAMRTLRMRSVLVIIAQTAVISSSIMLIIANANLLGWVLAYERIPQAVAAAFLSVTHSSQVFLLFVVVLLLIVGLFLEPSGAIIILTPVLLPTAESFGIDAVHFGVVMVFGLVIGLITPPVGLCLFIGSSIGNIAFHTLSRAVLPYIALLVLVYLLFVYFPVVSMWLPQALMP
jgi:C4-dicarboxylate transporter DctM subunit